MSADPVTPTTVSLILLGKSVIGGAFGVLTLCGVTVTAFGIDFTTGGEYAAAGGGGILGAILAVSARTTANKFWRLMCRFGWHRLHHQGLVWVNPAAKTYYRTCECGNVTASRRVM